MSVRAPIGMNVFDAAVLRMVEQYQAGHRIVVSLSGGKDSTCCLEVCVLAAAQTGRLPVEAVIRDEEILYPGSYEYVDRIWQRPDVDLHHLVAHQPIINAFNREQPYWWVFDPLLDPSDWVRQPPPYAEYITDLNIEAMTTMERFPVEPGQRLVSVVGLRVQESRGRMYGLFSAGGHVTKPHPLTGAVGVRPIYDWTDADIWLAIHKFGWDYNTAYDTMHRLGIPRHKLRIGPPSMNGAAIAAMQKAASAWPHWWDKVCRRLPGMRSAAQFGLRVVTPVRRTGESWRDTYQRECIDNAPAWIADRSREARRRLLTAHAHHSSAPFPEVEACRTCIGNAGSWKTLCKAMYCGDPFVMRVHPYLPYVEPEFFRPGAGRWNGHPG